ncbi:MAG: hypothetical protein LKJ76_08560 [Lachnospiraceae bacterium]|nr:hypothetical protein [Lachnospiraceae bacterium]
MRKAARERHPNTMGAGQVTGTDTVTDMKAENIMNTVRAADMGTETEKAMDVITMRTKSMGKAMTKCMKRGTICTV